MVKISLVKEKTSYPKVKIEASRQAYSVLIPFFEHNMELFESFYILLLNNSNNTIGYAHISSGGITGTVVDVRMVAKYALESLATGIILAHNHPSGNLKPSEADISLTKKLRAALSLLDINLLDHLILSSEGFYSFSSEGLL